MFFPSNFPHFLSLPQSQSDSNSQKCNSIYFYLLFFSITSFRAGTKKQKGKPGNWKSEAKTSHKSFLALALSGWKKEEIEE
jgi:hypothetical protein